MSRKKPRHDKQFKLNALKYVQEHPDLTQIECCKNLGISITTLARWKAEYEENDGEMPYRGSGNYSSDEQKEIARLQRELRDTQDALDVLKKATGILGKNLQQLSTLKLLLRQRLPKLLVAASLSPEC